MHSVRCYIAGLTFPAVFGPGPNVEQIAFAVPGPTTKRTATGRANGIGVMTPVPCTVVQHHEGEPDHTYDIGVGFSVIIFDRSGDSLTVSTVGATNATVRVWNLSIDSLRQVSQE